MAVVSNSKMEWFLETKLILYTSLSTRILMPMYWLFTPGVRRQVEGNAFSRRRTLYITSLPSLDLMLYKPSLNQIGLLPC